MSMDEKMQSPQVAGDPSASGPFQLSRSSDGVDHWFNARDAAAGVSIPAKNRDDAVALVAALNRAFAHHLRMARFHSGTSALTAEESRAGVVRSSIEDGANGGVDSRISVRHRDGGNGSVTIGTFLGDHRWIEGDFLPEEAAKIAELLSKMPSASTLPAPSRDTPVTEIVPTQRLDQLVGAGNPSSAEIHDMAVELLNWRRANQPATPNVEGELHADALKAARHEYNLSLDGESFGATERIVRAYLTALPHSNPSAKEPKND